MTGTGPAWEGIDDTSDGAHVVVIGAGQAGVQVAESLRSLGFGGRITLLGAEPHGPYHRPPLSKEWLSGDVEASQLVLRAPQALQRKEITLRVGTPADAIDLDRRRVVLADGEEIRFTGLALTTGARPRLPAVAGVNASGVAVLRTRDDADTIADLLRRCHLLGEPLVVVGGGFVGLEVAAAARRRDVAVHVVEALPRLMARAVSVAVSQWYAELHRGHGADIRLGAAVDSLETATGHGTAARRPARVRLADGRELPAGGVLVGVGVSPDDALARAAGIECSDGIVVDGCGRTSAPGVVAAGDCTATRLPDGSLRRLESVQNAVEQGRAAAAALLGRDQPVTATPWFWSRQYDVTLQIAGVGAGTDTEVLRGATDSGCFSVFRYGGGGLLAVDSVNATRDHLTARKLLQAGLAPTPDQAGDPSFDLASLLSMQASM